MVSSMLRVIRKTLPMAFAFGTLSATMVPGAALANEAGACVKVMYYASVNSSYLGSTTPVCVLPTGCDEFNDKETGGTVGPVEVRAGVWTVDPTSPDPLCLLG